MTFICIIVPDGYVFYEISHSMVLGGWLIPRSRVIAHVNGLPAKPQRVAVPHHVSPVDLVRRYAQRRGLLGVNVQVLNPLDI